MPISLSVLAEALLKLVLVSVWFIDENKICVSSATKSLKCLPFFDQISVTFFHKTPAVKKINNKRRFRAFFRENMKGFIARKTKVSSYKVGVGVKLSRLLLQCKNVQSEFEMNENRRKRPE